MNRDSRRNTLVKSESSHNWHLLISIGLLVFASFTLLNYHNQYQITYEPPIPKPTNPQKPEPAENVKQFSDKFFVYIDSVLIEYGLSTDLIIKKRNLLDEITIKIPADLPIPQVNLVITLTTQNLGGTVIYVVENDKNNNVKMQIGFNGIHTTNITLQEHKQERSTGQISVIVDSIKTVNKIVARICKIQQPLILSIMSENSSIFNSLKHCSHTLELKSTDLESLKSIAIKIDEIDGLETIKQRLWDLGRQANESNSITVIVQPRVNSLLALEEILPRLERFGHEFNSNPVINQ